MKASLLHRDCETVVDAGGRDEEEVERLLRLLEDVMRKVRELADRDTGLGVPSSVDQSSSLSLIVLPDIPIVMFMCNNKKSRDRLFL
jgi:hypothetical protein